MAAMDIFSDYHIFLLIEHQITHTSTTINAWSYSIFQLITENCSFWTFGAQYVSLVVCIYHRIYWAPKATYTLWLLGKPLVLIFYSYLFIRYLWASPWNKRLMVMTIMTSNDSHISHDECLVLTIYSLYILTYWAPNDYIHFYFIDFLF